MHCQTRLDDQLYRNLEQLTGFLNSASDVNGDLILSRITMAQQGMVNLINRANVRETCPVLLAWAVAANVVASDSCMPAS